MESLYNPNSFRASEHFPVKDYFKTYSEVCRFGVENNQSSPYKAIQEEMDLGLTRVAVERLAERCSLHKLRLPDQPEHVPMGVPNNLQTRSKLDSIYPITDKARQLNVISHKEILEKRVHLQSDFKMGSKRFLKTNIGDSNKSMICDITPGSDFIYSIIVYRPYSISFGTKNSAEKLRFAYEIEALGSNTLDEVADNIACITDVALFKEVENTSVDLSPLMNAKEHYPSKCIFIDGVFYNDLRSPKAVDYSQKIITWASEKNIGKFRSDIMELTSLDSLKPRLGYPYVYMHQGNCEHIFTFSDARLIQPGDCLYSKKYPRTVAFSRGSNVLCFICGTTSSQWIVTQCDRFPQEKVFLCTECCNSYLYIDGEKVTTFCLYPYGDHLGEEFTD